jgi:thermitase
MEYYMKKFILTLILTTIFPLFFVDSIVSSPRANKFPFQKTLPDGKKITMTRPSYVEGEVIVKFKNNKTQTGLDAMAKSKKLNPKRFSERAGVVRAAIDKNETVESTVQKLKKDPNVEYAEPVYLYYKSEVSPPNDTHWGQLWGHKNSGQSVSDPSYTTNSSNPGTSGKDIGALGAWEVSSDCDSITVAVLDTGVNYNHEDFVGNMWDGSSCVNHNGSAISGGCPNHGWDYASNDNDPIDEEGHGTHVAGIIGAVGNNNKGISGVCKTAKIMSVRVLGQDGGSNISVANGIRFAVRNGAKVINMSLGGQNYSSDINNALNLARDHDVSVIVAAGNEAYNLILSGENAYPCMNTQDNILCIAALDQNYNLANFSNRDSNSTVSSRHVDMGAPGTNVFSPYGDEEVFDEHEDGYQDWVTAGSGGTRPWVSILCGDYGTLAFTDCTIFDRLFNSGPFPTREANNINNRKIYKTFSINDNAYTVKVFQYLLAIGEYENQPPYGCYDYARMHANNTAGNPINSVQLPGQYHTGLKWFLCQNSTGQPFVFYGEKDLPICRNSSLCSIGYSFSSDESITSPGSFVQDFILTTWAPSPTAYSNLNGTSMASPYAAGVAALLRAYNPNFTYQDTLNKMIEGGTPETALTNTTRYGKAVNANHSMKSLNQITGVTAELQ